MIFAVRYGKFVFLMYMVTKLLYIGNAVGQIYLLDVFLGKGQGHS